MGEATSAGRVVSLPPAATLPAEVTALGPMQSIHKPNIPIADLGDQNISTYMLFETAIVAAQPDQTFVILRWADIVETDRSNSLWQALFSACTGRRCFA